MPVYGTNNSDTIIDNTTAADPNYIFFALGGNDTIVAGRGYNSYDGGTGIDAVDFWYMPVSSVHVNLATGIAAAYKGTVQYGSYWLTSIEDVWGSRGGDTIIGNDLANLIHGNEGDDIIDGGAGNDRLFGDAGIDTLVGGRGDDVLTGGAGRDRLFGGLDTDTLVGDDQTTTGLLASVTHGADDLFGGAGKDYLYGNYGNDLLVGGMGKDFLDGGQGGDTYRFESTLESTIIPTFTAEGLASGYDRIFRFERGLDRIDVSRIDADLSVAGDQAFRQVAGTRFTDEGQFRVSYNATNQITSVLFNTDSNLATAEMVIEINGYVPVTASDILL